jgi:hypothetical protein
MFGAQLVASRGKSIIPGKTPSFRWSSTMTGRQDRFSRWKITRINPLRSGEVFLLRFESYLWSHFVKSSVFNDSLQKQVRKGAVFGRMPEEVPEKLQDF